MCREPAAWVGAKRTLAEMDAGNAKVQDFGVPCRGQLSVKLDIARVLGQQPCQPVLVMTWQQRRQRPCRRPRVHDFAGVGMKHGDRQIRRQKPAVPVEHLAAFHLWGRQDAGCSCVGLVGGKQHHPRGDGGEHGQNHDGRHHKPHLGDAARTRRVRARRQHERTKPTGDGRGKRHCRAASFV